MSNWSIDSDDSGDNPVLAKGHRTPVMIRPNFWIGFFNAIPIACALWLTIIVIALLIAWLWLVLL